MSIWPWSSIRGEPWLCPICTQKIKVTRSVGPRVRAVLVLTSNETFAITPKITYSIRRTYYTCLPLKHYLIQHAQRSRLSTPRDLVSVINSRWWLYGAADKHSVDAGRSEDRSLVPSTRRRRQRLRQSGLVAVKRCLHDRHQYDTLHHQHSFAITNWEWLPNNRLVTFFFWGGSKIHDKNIYWINVVDNRTLVFRKARTRPTRMLLSYDV